MIQKIGFRRAIFKCHPSTFIKNQIDLSKSAQMTIFLADNNVKVCGWWLLLSAPRWRHLATCGDNRDNREHLTLALELPTLAGQALARLNCPGENKGWENISSFKYSWLAPSRPARCTIVPAIPTLTSRRPPLPRDRPVFRPVMSPGYGRPASHFGRRKWRKSTNTLRQTITLLESKFHLNINNDAPYIRSV